MWISLAWCWWGLCGRTRIATATGRTGWGLWQADSPEVDIPMNPIPITLAACLFTSYPRIFNRMVVWMVQFNTLNLGFFSHFAEVCTTLHDLQFCLLIFDGYVSRLYSTSCVFCLQKILSKHDVASTNHQNIVIFIQYQFRSSHSTHNTAWSQRKLCLQVFLQVFSLGRFWIHIIGFHLYETRSFCMFCLLSN